MTSIDDIWDEPLAPLSPPKHNENAETTAQRPLFLDSDSETESAPKPPADIDDLFKDIDDFPIEELQITPALDLDALRRAANAKHGNANPSHEALPSSSPGGGAQTTRNKDKEEEDGGTKKRKTIPRLDEGRLLGSNGIPALLKEAKKFKIKGKGHEFQDLNRLLTVYQYWSHQLYPRNKFSDTVDRVEKLCHSRRMHVALSVWYDEYKGLVNGKHPEDIIIDVDPDSDDDDTNQSAHGTVPVEAGVPTRPPSSASDRTSSAIEIDDVDMDAMIAEDEMRPGQQGPASRPNPTDTNDVDDEFDVAMWEDFPFDGDSMPDPSSHPPPPVNPPPPIHSVNEDPVDAMWDIVKELEAEQPTTPTGGEKPVEATSPPVYDPSNFDLEDMYA